MATDRIYELIKTHLATWSERDAEKRKSAIKDIYTDDIEVIDPFLVITGQPNLNDFIGDLLNKYPGYVFSVSGLIDGHHNIARLSWRFGPGTKPNAITGQDIFVISGGSIQKIFVFLDGI